ncbi:site-2 protease family protein [Cognatiyoonia sp. IB215182]|uniref:site-2 protease family protein n=1 Tax=Cognatiyoonia sp. IB215182 TaxID=3097353 RepID=UPI002A0F6531|nr:site-2 protease family protein [Cognatiyoonia sp. IB215182]MDX8354945.1 site-2 protease family protein [Cognatiyoonia sp. IB215182]
MISNATRLFDLDGFEIRLDPSWFLIAGLVTWTLASEYFPMTLPGLTGAAYLVLAIVAMLGFFGSLLLHELAHSFVARHFGVRIRAITLFLFGGVAELESEPPTAKAEFWIAIAGPVLSVVLGVSLLFCAGVLRLVAAPAAFVMVLSYLATINLIIAGFNMVPAFPMDGGRILRAALWHRHGDLLRATRVASRAGEVFGYVLVALGLLLVFQAGFVGGFWYILIGVFVLAAARSAYQSQLMQSRFAGHVVADVMIREPIIVSPDLTLSEFVNQVLLKHRISFAPVVADGVLIGQIDKRMLAAIDRDNWNNTLVGDIFVGLEDAAVIPPDLPLQALMTRIAQTGNRKFLVVKDHALVGVVTLASLIGYLHGGETAEKTRAW